MDVQQQNSHPPSSTNTAITPVNPKGPPVTLASALEGFFAMMVCLFSISYTKSVLIDNVSSSVYADDTIGTAQIGSLILLTVLLYGRRWRNYTLSPTQAWISVSKGFFLSFLRVPSLALVWEWLFLVVLYLVQTFTFGYFLHQTLSSPADTPSNSTVSSPSLGLTELFDKLMTCRTSTSLVWAPIIEELIFRVVQFYVVLHRSGGNVGLACMINACTFGAIHLSNIYYNVENIYSWLQMFGGVLCGTAWTLLYAITGSIPLVILLHILNNVSAIAWLGYNISIDGNRMCSDTVFTLELLVSMTIQIGVYIMVILACWRRLYSLIHSHDRSHSEKYKTSYSVPLWYNFKKLHPILYTNNDETTESSQSGQSLKKE